MTTFFANADGQFRGRSYRYASDSTDPREAVNYSHVDEREVRDSLWDVREGDHVLDLGSAFGSYSLSALAGGAARAVMFNPMTRENDLVRRSMTLNGWDGRYEVHQKGLWSSAGYLSDEDQEFVPGGVGLTLAERTKAGRYTQRFEVVPLDSLGIASDAGRYCVKVDVEGAEVRVIMGARRWVSDARPAFFLIERHDFKDPSLKEDLEREMAGQGYKMEVERPYGPALVHCVFVRRT